MDPIKQIAIDEAMKAMENLVGFKLTKVTIDRGLPEHGDGDVEYLNFEFDEKFRLAFPVRAIDKMRFLVAMEVPKELTIQ